MTMTNNEMLQFAKNELFSIVTHLINPIDESKARKISDEIIGKIDWNNSALMHKGLSWMAKNYLIQQKMI